jgi:hypothetical protein
MLKVNGRIYGLTSNIENRPLAQWFCGQYQPSLSPPFSGFSALDFESIFPYDVQIIRKHDLVGGGEFQSLRSMKNKRTKRKSAIIPKAE